MSALTGIFLILPKVAVADESLAIVYPIHAYEPVITDSKALSIPIGNRFGFEIAELKNPTPVDMFELSFLSRYDFAANSINGFAFSRPLVFRITVKGYSLFETADNDSNYFAFDRNLEQEIRRPRFLFSLTQHF